MRKPNARRSRPYNNNARSESVVTLHWSYVIVLAVCGCVLAAGFFLAARQHFASMDLGMKNSKLRKQVEDLEFENRRLLLAREIALSPGEIMRVARNLGFVESGALPVITAAKAGPSPVTTTVKTLAEKPETVGTLTKIAYLRPAKTDAAEASKPAGPLKKAVNTDTVKQKSIKPNPVSVAKR